MIYEIKKNDNNEKYLAALAGASVNSGLPLGAITAIYSDVVPQGWLLCDGSEFDTSKYPALAMLLNDNKTPDLTASQIQGTSYIIKAVSGATVEVAGDLFAEMKAYMQNQNVLSDWEDSPITTANTGYTMEYDGILIVQKTSNQDTVVTVNGSKLMESTGASSITMSFTLTVPFKKGDVISLNRIVTSYSSISNKIAYYKLRDYSGR